MDNSKLVTFGKYKNQPVETLLENKSYVEWFRSQPDLVNKHLWIYNLIQSANQLECTPEHNEMQNRFLDITYCEKIAKLFCKAKNYEIIDFFDYKEIDISKEIVIDNKILQKIAEDKVEEVTSCVLLEKIIKLNNGYYLFFTEVFGKIHQNAKFTVFIKVKNNTILDIVLFHDELDIPNKTMFYHAIAELYNIDIQYEIPLYYDSSDSFGSDSLYTSFNLKIELKPIIADDFMNILRKAVSQKIDLVLCDNYNATTVSFENAVEQFSRRNIILAKTNQYEDNILELKD